MPWEEMSPRLRSYELLLCHSAGFIDSQSNREDKSTPARPTLRPPPWTVKLQPLAMEVV